MPINAELRDFAKRTVDFLGEFGVWYVSPLRAFMSKGDNHENTKEVVGRGLTNETLKTDLQGLLSRDEMLAMCCGDFETLAKALDMLFFGPLPDAIYHGKDTLLGINLSGKTIDMALDELEAKVYGQGAFKKTAFFHVFNLNMLETFHPHPEWRFEDLSYERLETMLQPSAYTAFLRSRGGMTFAVVDDFAGFDRESVSDWLSRRWWEAMAMKKSIQLALDGTTDIDYVVPHYSPNWLNNLHGGGNFNFGTPRGDNPPTSLSILVTRADYSDITLTSKILKSYVEACSGERSTLQRAIGIAMEFFEESHRKHNRIERFANLMIALEALFTPSDKTELTLRVSQACAVLIGEKGSLVEPQQIYKFLRAMFGRRGQLFHGDYDANSQTPEKFINDEELAQLYSVVRKSIVAFICLYLREHRSLSEVRQKMELSILDDDQREALKTQSSTDGLAFT